MENIKFASPFIALMLKIFIKGSNRSLLFILAVFSCLFSVGQTGDGELVQFSGVVVTADSIKSVPFTHIYSMRSGRGTVADFNGFFSFVARKGETIAFSAVGFKKAYYHIPDTLSKDHYSLFQVMASDTVYLTETVIYPWPTREQFRQAFLNLKVPDDDLQRAYRNLARADIKDRMLNMPMDARENYRNFINRQIYTHSYTGMQHPSLTSAVNNPLLNPFAWSEFVKAWRAGKFKRNN